MLVSQLHDFTNKHYEILLIIDSPMHHLTVQTTLVLRNFMTSITKIHEVHS